MRKRIFEIMEINNKDDLPSTVFDIGLAVTIILNIVAMFCETFSSLRAIKPVFTAIENITVIIFIIEYVPSSGCHVSLKCCASELFKSNACALALSPVFA